MFKKKIPYIEFLPIIIITMILFNLLGNINLITKSVSIILSYVTSFIWAFGIAFLINPLMVYFEKKFKMSRGLSLLLVYLIVLGFIILLITIVTPTIIYSIRDLLNSLPDYFNGVQDTIESLLRKSRSLDNEALRTTIEKYLSNLNNYLFSILNPSINKGLNAVLTRAVTFTSSMVKIIFGFIVSIYMLKDKEIFIKNIKAMLYALLKEEKADDLIIFGREVNIIFSKYIIGKFIDSLIIGVMCFVGLSLLKVPYSPLLSLIVGITNMIPYFGPFIGMIPATLITMLSSPTLAFWVLVFIIILQQFDGWYLGPKILGSQVGLSPFWIILAITLGGGLFGVLGMFLGTPVVALIKMLLDRFISKRLKTKNIEL